MDDGVKEIEELVFYDKNKEVEETAAKESDEEHSSGRGVISNFISALVSKDSNEDEKASDGEERDSKEEEEKEGGILNNMASNLVSPSSPTVVKGGEQEAIEHSGGGGGGLIDNIVSHLPLHLADDAAPATEEASILIHCIVHD